MADTRTAIIDHMRDVLRPHNLDGSVRSEELHVRPPIIFEFTSSDGALSEGTIEQCFPRVRGAVELAHYTSFSVFESIIRSRELWLTSLLKRLDEHEFTTFATEHALDGYFDRYGGSPDPYYRTLARDLFYTSFTAPRGANQGTMFDHFAESGTGVQLIFRVEVLFHRADLRPIRYQRHGVITLIRELNESLKHRFGCHLVLRGISKIAAFYLPLGYHQEDEQRLLIKRYPEWRDIGFDLAKSNGRFEYWPLSIGEDNPFCRLDLVAVVPGPRADAKAVRAVLDASDRFHGVPLA